MEVLESNVLECLDEFNSIEKLDIRDKISMFSDIMAKHPDTEFGDMDSCPLKHTFADGMYVREIFIPKGTLVVGKIHRHSHPNMLMKGKVTVVTEGKGTEELEAPLSIISEAGTKRIVYAHEDTIWITIHNVGEEKDIDKIENIVITESYDGLLGPDNIIEIEEKI